MHSRYIPIYCILLAIVFLNACLTPSHDHPSGRQLAAELEDRSKQEGLALVKYTQERALLEIRYFDGESVDLPAECCPASFLPTIQRNRVAILDWETATPVEAKLRRGGRPTPAEVDLLGGPVVLLNEAGEVLQRSVLQIHPEAISVAPDETQFAFLGTPMQTSTGPIGFGIYVAEFDNGLPRLLMRVPPAEDSIAKLGQYLDWSPDGVRLVATIDQKIWVIDLDTRRQQQIAEGNFATWSPSGEWISYVSLGGEGMLLDPATGDQKIIDEHSVVGPIFWSPDGAYVLLVHSGCLPQAGCTWVYRVADGALTTVVNSGAWNPRSHWIDAPGSR